MLPRAGNMRRNDGRGRGTLGGMKWREQAESAALPSSAADPPRKPKPQQVLSDPPKPLSPAETQRDAAAGADTDVTKMLASVGLEKYAQVFREEGVDDMETALEMNEGHLAKLGIPLGHRLKILKKLREIKCGADPKAAPVRPAAEPVVPSRRETYELYKTALDEFRRTGVSHSSPEKPVAKPSPTKPKESARLQTEIKQESRPSPSIDARSTCSVCGRSYRSGTGTEMDCRLLCSVACREKYRKSAHVSCICGKEVLKSACVESDGELYCSRDCAPDPEEKAASGAVNIAETLPVDPIEGSEETKCPEKEPNVTPRLPRPPPRGRRRLVAPVRSIPADEDSSAALQDSVDAVRGWDAPVDASFDLLRKEE